MPEEKTVEQVQQELNDALLKVEELKEDLETANGVIADLQEENSKKDVRQFPSAEVEPEKGKKKTVEITVKSFINPMNGQKILAENAVKDKALMLHMVKMKAGFVREVKK